MHVTEINRDSHVRAIRIINKCNIVGNLEEQTAYMSTDE